MITVDRLHNVFNKLQILDRTESSLKSLDLCPLKISREGEMTSQFLDIASF